MNLAEQIRAIAPPNETCDDTFDNGWFGALEAAAELVNRTEGKRINAAVAAAYERAAAACNERGARDQSNFGLDRAAQNCFRCRDEIRALATQPEQDALAEVFAAAVDSVYLERNKLVALLATLFPSGIKRTAIEGWSEDWHGCVYIDFPWGQASWHYHDSQADLFAFLPPYAGVWDGHTTEAKYAAIVAACSVQIGGDA